MPEAVILSAPPPAAPVQRAAIAHGENGVWAAYSGLKLTSYFQPIFSLSHCRAIGHEGLLRAFDADSFPVSPARVIASASDFENLRYVDQLCRYLHVANYQRHEEDQGWLFLNVHPEVFRRGPDDDLSDFLPELTDNPDLAANRIVIEVMENAVPDNGGFERTVEALREIGCMIALDDFGAGHSNFDRIWTLRPEIVKLDRSFAVKAAEDPSARRLFPQIISLIHEAGSLVLLEGVETEAQALLALDSDIDFVQGFYFAMPAPDPVDTHNVSPAIEALWERFRATQGQGVSRYRDLIAPYINALGYGAHRIESGLPIESACNEFLALERADSCFLLDENGRQIGTNMRADQSYCANDNQYRSLNFARHARWSRRPYFRRAIEHVGKVQVTRPYLSISSGQLCVTVSVAFRAKSGQLNVLCGDLLWPQVV